MDSEQALKIIDNAVAQLQLTRNEHVNLLTAIELLKEVNTRFAAMNLEKKNPAAEKKEEKVLDSNSKAEA